MTEYAMWKATYEIDEDKEILDPVLMKLKKESETRAKECLALINEVGHMPTLEQIEALEKANELQERALEAVIAYEGKLKYLKYKEGG